MVNPAEVEAQLQRILASPTFVGSPRSAQFLSFCVFRGSMGRSVDLKETTIAVEVFKRRPDYDPKSDPIVRVHARRVREKLEQYYQTVGDKDPIRIDLPKGGYVPSFSRTLPHRKTDFSDWREYPISSDQSPTHTFGSNAVSPDSKQRRISVWMLSALSLATIITLVLLSTRSTTPTLQPIAAAMPLGFTGHVSDAAWSPDGVHIAYTLTEPSGSSHIYISVPGSTAPPQRITHENDFEMRPAWSPDGQRIAFLTRTDLSSFRIVTHGLNDGSTKSYGPFRSLPYVMEEHGTLDWSADGKLLLTSELISPSSPLRLVLISVATGERIALTAPPTGSSGDIDGRFSPDGKWVAFRRGGLGDLFVVSSKGEQDTPAIQLTNTMRGVRGIAWSPDTASIFFGTHDDAADRMGIWKIARTGGKPQPVTPADLDAVDPAISSKGKLVFTARTLSTTLMLHSLSTSTPDRAVFSANSIDKSPVLSPNGTHIAFVSNRSGGEQLWIGTMGDSAPRQITHFSALEHIFFPAWSPDSRLVAFSLRNGAATNIFVYDLVSDTLRQITATRNRDITPVFGADGKYVYYSSNDDGTSRLWRIRTDGTERAEPMFWEATLGYAPSSDGKWMYFIEAGKMLSLVRRNLQDGSSETVFQTAGSPSFSNDLAVVGSLIYMAVSANDDSRADVLQIDPEKGESKVVAHLRGIPSAEICGFSISADGRLLISSELTHNESTLYAQDMK